jgi:hypothetical protein
VPFGQSQRPSAARHHLHASGHPSHPEVIRTEPGGRLQLRLINAASSTGTVVGADGHPVRPMRGTPYRHKEPSLVAICCEWRILALNRADPRHSIFVFILGGEGGPESQQSRPRSRQCRSSHFNRDEIQTGGTAKERVRMTRKETQVMNVEGPSDIGLCPGTTRKTQQSRTSIKLNWWQVSERNRGGKLQ